MSLVRYLDYQSPCSRESVIVWDVRLARARLATRSACVHFSFSQRSCSQWVKMRMLRTKVGLEGVHGCELHVCACCDNFCTKPTAETTVAVQYTGQGQMVVMVEEVNFSVAITEGDGVVDKPLVVQVLVDLGHLASVLRAHGKHLVEELKKARREVLPHAWRLGGPPALPLHELVVVGIAQCCLLPRETAGQHTEEEDAHGPHVAGRVYEESRLVGRVADLGGSVGDAAAYAGDVRTGAEGHAEIDDLH